MVKDQAIAALAAQQPANAWFAALDFGATNR